MTGTVMMGHIVLDEIEGNEWADVHERVEASRRLMNEFIDGVVYVEYETETEEA